MPQIKVADRLIGGSAPIFIIAEAGTAHNGSLQKAFELIDAAREAGADCVKFQYVIADEIVHPKAGAFPLLGKSVDIYRRFRALEQPFAFYEELNDYCRRTGILFLCSPFGPQSARQLLSLKPAAVKIASPELNHYPMLACFRGSGVPLFVSTGVSTLSDIRDALAFIDSPVALLHCVTTYPMPPEEAGLGAIAQLARRFRCVAGFSDHSEDPLLVPMTAAACGASIIEKHFTLSHSGDGLDDPFALEPMQLSRMVKALRRLDPLKQDERLQIVREEFGAQRIDQIRGKKKKKLTPEEKTIYKTTNRSLLAITDILPGEALSEKNCALLRSEHNLRPGLPPKQYAAAMKKKAAVPIANGSAILMNMLKKR